ncbi:Subtilisin-like protease 2 [Colletotrichum sidae]|uniref:Subtilisin-like protease 2 n=1 Tax=Colletotrichum sidae TaxID=1347389 RepID=A0A4R8TAZ6_9PEZI|nr:Subtilisin-like protease 2 [Colletotrichum sidae]
MTPIRLLALLHTFFTVCDAQNAPRRSSAPRFFGNSTLSRTTLPPTLSATPTQSLSSSSGISSSAPRPTIVASNGATVAAVAGAVILGGIGGGFWLLNGITTPIAAGASAIAGGAGAGAGAGAGEAAGELGEELGDDSNNNDQEDESQDLPTSLPFSLTMTTAAPSGTESGWSTSWTATSSSATSSSATSSSATSSSATPSSSALPEYVINAKEGTSKADGDGFTNTLVSIVGGKDKVQTLLDENKVPYMWLASLTGDQLEKVRADKVVEAAEVEEVFTFDIDDDDEDNLFEIDIGGKTQKRAPKDKKQDVNADNAIIDLRMLSTPPGEKLSGYYGYDDSAGQGITIYLIDGGPFVFEHSELKPSDPSITRENINVMEHPYAMINQAAKHGTCVASKAVGKTTGVAHRANLVTVRVDITPGEFYLQKIWQTVLDDIIEKNLKGKAVVSTSVVSYRKGKQRKELLEVIEKITKLDVPVICAAGNSGPIEPSSLPATLAKEVPIIVVGSATQFGTMAEYSQRGDSLSTWAVGSDVLCADYSSLGNLRKDSGTSFAAPQIAGLAAYLMADPEFKDEFNEGTVARDVRDFITTYSHPRGSTASHPNIAWNGFETCGARFRKRRRLNPQDGEACELPAFSTPSAQPAAPLATPSATPSSAPPPTTEPPAEPPTELPTGELAAVPVCALQGTENKEVIGTQAGCPGLTTARQVCWDNASCKSWSYGEEDRNGVTIAVCNYYGVDATKASKAADPKAKAGFKYYDKTCKWV